MAVEWRTENTKEKAVDLHLRRKGSRRQICEEKKANHHRDSFKKRHEFFASMRSP